MLNIIIKLFFNDIKIHFFEDIGSGLIEFRTSRISEKRAIILKNIFEKEFNYSTNLFKAWKSEDENSKDLFWVYFMVNKEDDIAVKFIREKFKKIGISCIEKK